MELTKFQIESILDTDEPVPPDPRQDLKMLADLCTKAKFSAQIMGADEDVLQRFEDYLVYVDFLIKQATPPPPPPMVQPGMPPMIGPPGAPPPGAPPLGLPTQVMAPGMGGPVG